ncbi:hypothetical protein DERF_008636 [Dermatophagoides farinae]|uniref:Uncharacterized protein n=1 Tax=Dermatophagoides farinae TaxID=6954 RepID=A0A922I3V0_DERFA|nr:hypothetical protein DERF_008636 [Dermatophagoides farinae]
MASNDTLNWIRFFFHSVSGVFFQSGGKKWFLSALNSRIHFLTDRTMFGRSIGHSVFRIECKLNEHGTMN